MDFPCSRIHNTSEYTKTVRCVLIHPIWLTDEMPHCTSADKAGVVLKLSAGHHWWRVSYKTKLCWKMLRSSIQTGQIGWKNNHLAAKSLTVPISSQREYNKNYLSLGENVDKSVFSDCSDKWRLNKAEDWLPSFLLHSKQKVSPLAPATKSVDIKISFNAARLQIVPSLELHYTNNRLLLLAEHTQNGPRVTTAQSPGSFLH